MTNILKIMAMSVLISATAITPWAQAQSVFDTPAETLTQTAKVSSASVETYQAIRAAKSQSDFSLLNTVVRQKDGSFKVTYLRGDGSEVVLIVVPAKG